MQFTRLSLELEKYDLALQILQGIMAVDDTSVDAWYLEGWCFFLLAMTTREAPSNNYNGLTWEELARDARECLESCQSVSSGVHPLFKLSGLRQELTFSYMYHKTIRMNHY
jgi:hypothetical protein